MDPISYSALPIVEIKAQPKNISDLSPPEVKSEGAC